MTSDRSLSWNRRLVFLLRRLVLGVVFMALAGCASGQDAQRATPPGEQFDERQVVALVPDAETRDRLTRAAAERGYTPQGVTELPSLGFTMLTFGLPPGVTGATAIEVLEAAAPGASVGLNHAYRLQTAAPSGGSQLDYATTLLGWPAGGCAALVPVGLIDTNVDASAPGLSQARIFSRSFASGAGAELRHGTELASAIADPTRLRNVTIYNANVIGNSPEVGDAASTDALILALDWLAGLDVRIVNIALAGPYNKLLDLAVGSATSRGVIIVAAVGNAGPDAAPQFPAAFDDVIAVTAVDAERRLFTNAVQGRHVDIAAPGVDVLVQGGSGARFVTGTSIATSFVTAWIAADPELMTAPNAQAAHQRLREASEDLGASGPDPMFGAGLLKAQGLCAGNSG